jgi:hypothetical protein
MPAPLTDVPCVWVGAPPNYTPNFQSYVANTTGASSVSGAFATNAANSIVLVAFTWSTNDAPGTAYSVTSVTYAGLSFTRLSAGASIDGVACYGAGLVTQSGKAGMELWWAVAPTPVASTTLTVTFTPLLATSPAAIAGIAIYEVTNLTTPSAPFDAGVPSPIVVASLAPSSVSLTTSYPSSNTNVFTDGTAALGNDPVAPAANIYIATAVVGSRADLYMMFTGRFGAGTVAHTPTAGFLNIGGFNTSGGHYPRAEPTLYTRQEPAPTTTPPANLRCGIAATTSITPTWDAVAGAVYYNLRYRVVGTTPWTTITNINTTSYTITGLTPSTAYEWQVSTQLSAYSSSFTCATLAPGTTAHLGLLRQPKLHFIGPALT